MKRCLGCMREYGEQNDKCPACGFSAEEMRKNPDIPEDILPLESVLSGRFIIGRPLSCSDYSFVYLAWDGVLRRRVAIREYFPRQLAVRKEDELVQPRNPKCQGLFEKGLEAFVQEAQKLHRNQDLEEPVNIYRVLEENNTAYTVMEYIKGETVADFLERGEKVEDNVTVQLLGAVKRLHDRGIAHFNLSSDNVFIDEDGRIRLLDFGVARWKLYEFSGGRIGTFQEEYMAPELLARKNPQMNADLYSVGVIGYEIHTGRFLWQEPKMRKKKYLKTGDRDTDIIVSLLTEKDAGKRPKTAGDILEMLENRARGRK